MLKYNGKVNIEIGLLNGVYYFKIHSGVGKSRLAKLLKSYSLDGDDVVSYTYTDKALGIPLNHFINKVTNPRLLLLDRYDLYNGDFKEEIEEFAKTGVVLIDIKGPTDIRCCECVLTMTNNTIEVRRDD